MSRTKFIIKQLLLASLPMIIILTIFILIDTFVFKEALGFAIWQNNIFILLAFPTWEFFSLFSVNKRAKKLGIDIWTKENQNGSLAHQIVLHETKAAAIEKLSQGNWKYKIIETVEADNIATLSLKHYQFTGPLSIKILLEEISADQLKVTFETHTTKLYKWQLVFSNWAMQLKQIEYFQNILLSQEVLNKDLSFIQ